MRAATILGSTGGKEVGIHPVRVKKLMVLTNIYGKNWLTAVINLSAVLRNR